MRNKFWIWAWAAAWGFGALPVAAEEYEKEPINYSASQPDNAVERLLAKLAAGKERLAYDDKLGYLPAVLAALEVPRESQMLVYSKTSLQRDCITPETPRAIYFNDEVYVGYCQQGQVMELSAVDPQLGAVFYTLNQQAAARPRLERQGDSCLTCHSTQNTQSVPGHLVRSVFPDQRGLPLLAEGTYRIDHTSPVEQRWGGWYVTGKSGAQTHLGNMTFAAGRVAEQSREPSGMNVVDLQSYFACDKYLTPHSDIVALMVLEHQTQAHNYITRANFLTRQALHYEAMLNRELKEAPDHRWDSTTSRIKNAGEPLVEYLLFCDEAELTAPIEGATDFAQTFAARGPRDAQNRSLRDFDLQRRMFKHPCSYTIDSPAFAALPREVKDYVYRRLKEVLTGADQDKKFAHLSAEDRQAILEILLATHQGLPDDWREKR